MTESLRSGLGGVTGDEPEHERDARAEREWRDADLAVVEAAHLFKEVLGNRRRSEADRERERSHSRFL